MVMIISMTVVVSVMNISNHKIIKDNNNIDKIGDNETNDAIWY